MADERSSTMSHSSLQKNENDSDVPVVASVGATAGGIGVPTGATRTSWGNTFQSRKDFFQRQGQEELTKFMRTSLRGVTGHTSPKKGTTCSSSPVPTPNATIGLSSDTNNNHDSVSDELTGQKERVTTETVSVGHSDKNIRRSEVTKRETKVITTNSVPGKSTQRPKSCSVVSSSNSEQGANQSTCLKTHKLDGLEIHKDKEGTVVTTTTVPQSGSVTVSHANNTTTTNTSSTTSTPTRTRKATTSKSSSDDDLLDRITKIMKEKNRLDAQLTQVIEENNSLTKELNAHQEVITDLRDHSNDLKKQKESVQSENASLSRALALAEKEKDTLVLAKQKLQSRVKVLDKEAESVHKSFEEKKLTLKKDLEAVVKARDKLREENSQLGQELLNEQIAKQKYLDTIKETQDRVSVLENELQKLNREKDTVMKARDRNLRIVDETQKKSNEKDKRLKKMEKEMTELRNQSDKIQNDFEKLSKQLRESTTANEQLNQQMDEIKWEKQQLEQRMAIMKQTEGNLKSLLEQIMSAVDDFGRDAKNMLPSIVLVGGGTTSKGMVRVAVSSPDPCSYLKKIKNTTSAVLDKLGTVVKRKDTLEGEIAQLWSQLKTRDSQVDQLQRDLQKTKEEFEATHSKLEAKTNLIVESYEHQIYLSQQEMAELKQHNIAIQDKSALLATELDGLKLEYSEQLYDYKHKLSDEQTAVESYVKCCGHLLANQAIIGAQLRLATKKNNIQERNKFSFEQLQIERKKMADELEQLHKERLSTLVLSRKQREEYDNLNSEKEKAKVHFINEISLLKEQISVLEKEKDELKSNSSTSAFQPIQPSSSNLKVMFDPEKSQTELLELRHKVTLMEAENRRLQDIAQTSNTMMDAGNALRKHTLEMRKRCVFLESEKKQLTDKVHTLHTSLKTLRESKDRMISDRLKALQSENMSLQDSIRTSETMFNKKLMCAASRIAETLKENDTLRHALDHLQKGLGNIDSIMTELNQLSSAIQHQEQDLATLRASLASSGSNLIPALEISERILATHVELQSIFTSEGIPGTLSVSHASTATGNVGGVGTRPPVLQQFSSEYISSLEGGGGGSSSDKAIPITRTRSHSQSNSVTVTTFVLQLREKMSQLHADNMSVCNLIRHGQENLESRQKDVCRLRDKLLSLLTVIHTCLKVMHESHDQLVTLSQQSLPVEQMASIEFLEREVENWQDKVFACEIALKDIETRMQEDYESHNQRFSQHMSQILDLKEENSSKRDKLLANEQYIKDIEERCLNAENELFKLRKEMESIMQEALKVPEGFQDTFVLRTEHSLHGGHISDLIRSQNEALMSLKLHLNSTLYQLSRLQTKMESVHRENAILKHQGLENDRHHSKILEELYKERDYLRRSSTHLIENHYKTDEASEMLKKIKRSLETEKDLKDFRKMFVELNNAKLAIREKDMTISELQHQLENQQLEFMKLFQSQSLSATDTHQAKLLHPPPGRSRPLSANSVESARPSRYRITNPDHPKVINRNPVTSKEGDFLIRIPATNTSFNLSEPGNKSGAGTYTLGFPVVTDDEGANFSETNILSATKQHTKGRLKRDRHRRTHSEGSDSLKSLMSSESSASDSKPTKQFNQASTLPRQQIPFDSKRPGSAESISLNNYSPVDTPTPCELPKGGDMLCQYAQHLTETIDELIHQDDIKTDDPKSASNKLDKVGRSSAEKSGKGDWLSAKFRKTLFGSKSGNVSVENKGDKSVKTSLKLNVGANTSKAYKNPPSQTYLMTGVDLSKNDEISSSSASSSNQVSRMTSFASTVDRSNSFASTVSTNFSEREESSPFSNVSMESISITDSMDNLMAFQGRTFQRDSSFTPIHPYTSSSDDETNGTKRTLKRTSASYYKSDLSMPRLFPITHHHRATSSCDSDQLLTNMKQHSGSKASSVNRNESISISDMDKEQTDREDFQIRINRLEKKFGKARRSSTGSITICNQSGSSLEDIKNAGD